MSMKHIVFLCSIQVVTNKLFFKGLDFGGEIFAALKKLKITADITELIMKIRSTYETFHDMSHVNS